MGSGVALQFGIKHPDTAATIAVSPVGQSVRPDLPHNLLLMAGSLEASFVRSAQQRLTEAGGAGRDPRQGTARQLVIVPGVEHMTILFAPRSHAAIVDWLNQTFGPQPGATPYADPRMIWYRVGIAGMLLLAAVLGSALWSANPEPSQRPLWWRLGALTLGGLAATVLLWIANRLGLQLRALFGVLVGGYLLIWFGVAGAVSLLLLWTRLTLPSRRAVLGGLAAFAALWLSVGLLGQLVWFPWLLIWPRLRLWPLAVFPLQ